MHFLLVIHLVLFHVLYVGCHDDHRSEEEAITQAKLTDFLTVQLDGASIKERRDDETGHYILLRPTSLSVKARLIHSGCQISRVTFELDSQIQNARLRWRSWTNELTRTHFGLNRLLEGISWTTDNEEGLVALTEVQSIGFTGSSWWVEVDESSRLVELGLGFPSDTLDEVTLCAHRLRDETTVDTPSLLADTQLKSVIPFPFTVSIFNGQGLATLSPDQISLLEDHPAHGFSIYMGNSELSPSAQLYQISQTLKYPWYATLGERDKNRRVPWKKAFGPGSFRFDVHGVRFTLIDSVDHVLSQYAMSLLEDLNAPLSEPLIAGDPQGAPVGQVIVSGLALKHGGSKRKGLESMVDVARVQQALNQANTVLQVAGNGKRLPTGDQAFIPVLSDGTSLRWLQIHVGFCSVQDDLSISSLSEEEQRFALPLIGASCGQDSSCPQGLRCISDLCSPCMDASVVEHSL